MNLAEARQLFDRYDGSHFYMDRDGWGEAYRQADVPAAVEAGWLLDLKAMKLAALSGPGNWATIHFLNHHSMFDCASQLLGAQPIGSNWERAAFLEELLAYARRARLPDRPAFIAAVQIKALEQAAAELRFCKSEALRERLERLRDCALGLSTEADSAQE